MRGEYQSWPPVFQWETELAASPRGNVYVTLEEREYEISWHEHPADLVYASIWVQTPSNPGAKRQRSAEDVSAVELVYDRRRAAVVAIHGDANGFHPFVEAFRIGCLGQGRLEREQG